MSSRATQRVALLPPDQRAVLLAPLPVAVPTAS
jgi:hypothetical protein